MTLTENTKLIKQNWIELTIWAVAIAFFTSMFCFAFDLCHTSNCSLAYLQGHILDFYDYNIYTRNTDTIVYYPTIYILFAFWNIPLALLGKNNITYDSTLCLFWSKGLGIVFLLFAHIFVYKISMLLFNDKKKAFNSIFTLATFPIFFMFSFPWALYDTVWLSFLLGGIYFSMRNTKRDFIYMLVFFAISVSVKTFVLFVIFPVLFFKVKNIIKLIFSAICVMSIYVLETVIYRNSEYFVNNVISPLNGGFLINSLFGISFGGISLLLVIFVCICLYNYQNENNNFNLIFSIYVISSMFPCISRQTPNWHVIYIPFFAILTGNLNKRERNFFSLLALAISLGIFAYIMATRGCYFSETSLGAGIFGKTIFGSMPVSDLYQSQKTFFSLKLFGIPSEAQSFASKANKIMNYANSLTFACVLFSILWFRSRLNVTPPQKLLCKTNQTQAIFYIFKTAFMRIYACFLFWCYTLSLFSYGHCDIRV